MGTYLNLSLLDKSDHHIEAVNHLWNQENPGYENTLHFVTSEDIRRDIEYIKTDPKQKYLRYIQTVEDWNKSFPIWGTGKFQVKITMGNYLCSEMATRYIRFIEAHPGLFREKPDDYVMNILRKTAQWDHRAKSCLVKCKFCDTEKE